MSSHALYVLLIEDNPPDIELIEEYLGEAEDIRFRVTVATRLQEGLEKLGQRHWDVVLLDLSLPDSPGGFETLDRIIAKAPSAPTIILTGADERELGLDAVRRGAQDFLDKNDLNGPLLLKSVLYATERAKFRIQIRERDDQLRLLMGQLPAVVWAVDRGLYFVSSRGARLAELKLTPDEVVGKSLFDYFQTDDPKHPSIAAHLEALRGEEQTLDIHWHGHTWRSVMQPWRGEDKTIRGVIGVALDITESLRAQEDAEVAALIHRALLPQKMPEMLGFDIAGVSSPTGATGGDFIDFITLLNGTLQIAVGDVCGHGTGPALLMATTRAYCRALSNVLPNLRDVCETLNGLILADGVVGRFVSLFLARIHPKHRTLTFTSAGHPSGYIIAADGSTRHELRSIGLLLGVSPAEDYPTRGPIALESGDIIVLMTDGLIEACPTNGSEFGTERIVQCVHRHRKERAAVIVDLLMDEVRHHAGEAAHYDDESAVVIKVL